MALLLGAAVWQGCRKAPQAARATVIVISGDTQGWITPCGCTANQSGGLLRRATYLNRLRASVDVLYFDAGGAGAGDSPFEVAKLEATLAGECAMGISAHNIGGSELAYGAESLQRIAGATHVPLVSANVRVTGGAAIAPALRIFNCSGRRLAVIGVLSPRYAVDGVTVDDPRQAVIDTMSLHNGEFDAVLVLAYLPQEELEQLAAALPEVDAIVGGPTGQSIVPRSVGPVLLASATNKGKFLVRLNAPETTSDRWSGEVVELGPSYGDDPTQLANLEAYLDRLRDRDFTAAESGFAPILPTGAPRDYRVAGNASCLSCHADSAIVWSHSLHAAAGKTLEGRHFEADPDCLRCHTTGYGLPGGFISPLRTPLMYGVGCESCHGPSEAHVNDPKVHTEYLAFDQCIRCHDEENSPAFNRPIYWQRIRHGMATTLPSQPGVTP
jgi:hypothetical protein